MASAKQTEPSVDPPQEEIDLTKPYWIGYFRLPKEDVQIKTRFEPDYKLLPEPPRKPLPCNLMVGCWTHKKDDGVKEEKEVLVKSVNVFNEREARILSSVSGSDALACRYNIVRFYGAAINEEAKEYMLVLERCNMYLQDYVLDKSNTPDPLEWQTRARSLCQQVANGMRYLHWKAPYNPIVHRDLHPLSVLLIQRENGDITAKLSGFQHAKCLGPHVTVGGHTVAPTSAEVWQAPEYVRNPMATRDSPVEDYMMVDVYSYAILVWHIFTRQLPYGGEKIGLAKLCEKLDNGERPAIPEDTPEFWCELMKRAWHDNIKKRPDFVKIWKAIEKNDSSILDPHHLLEEEELDKRAPWQLDPKNIPEDHGRIISNKTKSLSVVLESKDGKFVLKKPIKENGETPSDKEFGKFMELFAGLGDHPNILCYDGVFYLESLRMPHMKCSVRQHLEGKRVIRDGETHRCFKGWGSVQPTCLKQVAMGVASGLAYLHSKDISHDGLSSSNVLLSYENLANIEVKLVDFQLGLLGTSSQSHASQNCKYQAPEGTDPKRADLYSLGVLMVYIYKGEPSRKVKKNDWEKKTSDFENDRVSGVVEMWKKVVNKCLSVDSSLTADDAVSTLASIVELKLE